MRYLITGSAGFIGSHLAKRLLCDGHSVHGVDGLKNLKRTRHTALAQFAAFTATETMLENTGH